MGKNVPQAVQFFRDQLREPLRRTRNNTIARHDIAKLGAAAGGRRFDKVTGSQAGKIGNAKRWGGKTAEERRAILLVLADARRRKTTPEQRSAASRKGALARWAAMTSKEREDFAAKGRAARLSKYGAPWPYPFTRVTDRTASLANLRRGPAAAAKARKLLRFRRHR